MGYFSYSIVPKHLCFSFYVKRDWMRSNRNKFFVYYRFWQLHHNILRCTIILFCIYFKPMTKTAWFLFATHDLWIFNSNPAFFDRLNCVYVKYLLYSIKEYIFLYQYICINLCKFFIPKVDDKFYLLKSLLSAIVFYFLPNS